MTAGGKGMGCVQRREGVPDENPCRVRGEAIWRGQRRWALRQGLHTQQRSGQPCTTDRGLTHPETRVTVTQCITATDWGAGSGFPHSLLSHSPLSLSWGPSLSQALPSAAFPWRHHHTHTPSLLPIAAKPWGPDLGPAAASPPGGLPL